MTEGVTARLDRLVGERLGHVLDPWPRALIKRVEVLAEREGETPAGLLDRLIIDPRPDVVAELVSSATIGHTAFFRHAEHFDRLQAELASRGKARIWCLGCATGEEPYSLALAARRADAEVEILATDIDAEAVGAARVGHFAAGRTRGLADRGAMSDWRADAELRGRIRFEVESMLEGLDRGRGLSFDYVFCRNLLIYHPRAEAARLLQRLARIVTPGGALVVAPTEGLLPLPEGLHGEAPIGWLSRHAEIGRAGARPPVRHSLVERLKPPRKAPAPRPAPNFEPLSGPHPRPGVAASELPGARELAARQLSAGDLDAAEATLRQRLNAGVDDAVAWFLLGEVLLARAEGAQARAAFEQAARRCAGADGVDPETLAAAAKRRAQDVDDAGSLTGAAPARGGRTR